MKTMVFLVSFFLTFSLEVSAIAAGRAWVGKRVERNGSQFVKYVHEAADKSGITIDDVIAHRNEDGPDPSSVAAWVPSCITFPRNRENCKTVVNIYYAQLIRGNQYNLKFLAYHEVCHLALGQDMFWADWDPQQRDMAHVEVTHCMKRLLGGPAKFQFLKKESGR